MAGRFEGKVAVVTGAGAGIGRAVALALHAEGALVVANDVQEERLAALGRDAPIVPVAGSTADPGTPGKLVEAALAAGGAVDVLVNNAGISKLGDAETFDLDDWRRIIEIDLNAYFYVAQAVGRQMIAQRRGAIVNVSSTSGLSGMPRNAAYVAAKHGVVGLTRALAIEWARYGIRVNAICPGLTETETIRELERAQPELIGARRASTLLGRLALPEDQARVVLFLLSDEAAYVNGLIANVDGGGLALYAGYPAPRIEP